MFTLSISKIYDQIEAQSLECPARGNCGADVDFKAETHVSQKSNCPVMENHVANTENEAMGNEAQIGMVRANEENNSKTTENPFQWIVETSNPMEIENKSKVLVQVSSDIGSSNDNDTLQTISFNHSVDSVIENKLPESPSQMSNLLMNLNAEDATEVHVVNLSLKRKSSAENNDELTRKRPKKAGINNCIDEIKDGVCPNTKFKERVK